MGIGERATELGCQLSLIDKLMQSLVSWNLMELCGCCKVRE